MLSSLVGKTSTQMKVLMKMDMNFSLLFPPAVFRLRWGHAGGRSEGGLLMWVVGAQESWAT